MKAFTLWQLNALLLNEANLPWEGFTFGLMNLNGRSEDYVSGVWYIYETYYRDLPQNLKLV